MNCSFGWRLGAIPALPILVGLAACTTPSPSPVLNDGRPLRVATWNLEHLAEQNGLGCRPRTDADYAVLVQAADALDADVIAFQEVESAAAAARVFSPTKYQIIMSARPRSGRGGGCYGRPGQAIRHQGVGFAVRRGFPIQRNSDLAALALNNPDLRWGLDITLKTKRPLRLLALHLKSGCNSGRAATDRDCDVLFAQLPLVERWVEERAATGEAFMVLGDWNRWLASSGDAFFADLSDNDPEGAILTLTSADRPAACKSRCREFIDYIAAGPRAAARVIAGSFAEFTYGLPEEQHPTDHCPVSVEVAR